VDIEVLQMQSPIERDLAIMRPLPAQMWRLPIKLTSCLRRQESH